jgi:ATP-dependent DNA helicase DinG
VEVLKEKLLADVDAILGPNGLIARNGGKRLRHSAQQHQYARRVAIGFSRFDEDTGKTAINMLQAATGTGKTIGYLVPLMLFAAYGKGEVARVAVSTYTRHLQKQILDHDAVVAADWVFAITGIRLTIGLRMGIGNFVSAVAAARLSDTLSRFADNRFDEAIDFLDDLIDWAGSDGNSGLLHDFLEERELGYLPFGVTPDAVALDHHAPNDEKAAYQAMIKASKDVDVLVVNHSLLVTNALRWSALLDDPDKRPMAALVCDEADRLPDAAESVTGAGLSLHRLSTACSALGDAKAQVAAEKLQEFVRGMKVPAIAALAIENQSELTAHLRATLQILRPVGAQCASSMLSSNTHSSDDVRVKQAAFLDALQQIESAAAAIEDRESTAIISWSPVREYPSLRIGRPNPGRILSRLWNLRRDSEDKSLPPSRGYLDAVLLTSATLETPGRTLPKAFDEFASSVGVVRHATSDGSSVHNVTVDLFACFEPSKFGQMKFVLASPGAPLPSFRNETDETWDTNSEWLDYAAAMVRAAHASGGRTLVLTLSWRDTMEIARRLTGLDSLIVQQRGQTLREVVGVYVGNDRSVLLTPSGWEGLDLPGLIQNLVITRIPFVPSDTSLDVHRTIHFEHLGFAREKITSILHNERESTTRRKLAQGLGRGLRKPDDAVTVWIGDPRFPLPVSFADSLDPVLLDMPTRRTRISMRFCIPQRFRETTYTQSRLFLLDGTLHTPTDLGCAK